MVTGLLIFTIMIFLFAYFTYGRFLSKKILCLDDSHKTPAHLFKDGIDFVPARTPILFGHHFSSIAGAGPIIGPIIAGFTWGWLPVFLWILFGCIFLGAVHDTSAIVVSIRNKAQSIAEISKIYLSNRVGMIFKIFIWLALLYVVAVFINVAQLTFVSKLPIIKNGEIIQKIPIGGGVATSAIFYILLAIIFGYLIYKKNYPLSITTFLFVILVYAGIYLGQLFPIKLSSNIWGIILIIYCGVASVLPVWILLQPRDYLSSFLLYGVIIGLFLGIIFSFGKVSINQPAFIHFNTNLGPLFPILFIIVACGAISGFHSLVGSGTTAKQLDKETDALRIGYGAMLMEGVMAVIALIIVMIISSSELNLFKKNIAGIYGLGVGELLHFLGIPKITGMAFGMLALSAFVLTTVDTAIRLSRYIFTELTGIKNRFIATGISLILPAILVFVKYQDPITHKYLPVWKALWPVFGATNQLIGALAFLVGTIWLLTTKNRKYWFILGIPTILMITITISALILLLKKWKLSIVGVASLIQIFLAVWIVIEGIISFKKVF